MRIAQVAPAGLHPYSGVLTVIAELSAALARRGHAVELWQLSPWPSADTAGFAAQLGDAGVTLVPGYVRSPVMLGADLRRVVAESRADVVHLHNSFSPANNLLAARLTSPYVVTVHGGYAQEQLAFHRWRKALFAALFERRLLDGAATVVALTEVERREIAAFRRAGDAAVVPNAVPVPPAVDGAAFRRRLGIRDQRLMVFVGKLDHYHKRVGELVEAAIGAPGWHLALVGPDWRDGRNRVLRRVDEAGANGRVHLVEPLRGAALHEAYAAGDVFGLMSRWEGFSISLLEALAHGTPAVLSPEVERRLGVVGCGAGWLATPEGLAGVLGDLAGLDQAEWERRRTAARAYAGRHTWDEIAGRYEEVFRAAVAEH